MGKKKPQNIVLGAIGQQAGPQQQPGPQQQHPEGSQQQQQQHPQGSQQQQRPQQHPEGSQQQKGPKQQPQGSQQQKGSKQHQQGSQQQPQGSQQQKGPQQHQQGSQQQKGPQQHQQGSQQQKGPKQHQQGSQQQKGPQQHQQGSQQQKGPQQQQQGSQQPAWPQQQKGPQQQQQGSQQPAWPQQHPQGSQQQKGPKQHQQGSQQPAWHQQQKGPQQQQQAWSQQQPQGSQQQPEQFKRKDKDGQAPKKQPDPTGPTTSEVPRPGSAVHRDASVSSAKSSGSGDGSLRPIEENLQQMRIAKEKIRRTDLRPVLMRSGTQGTRGKKVTVEANFFRLLLDKLKGVAYHYDVAIEPDRPKKFLRGVFAQFCKNSYPGVLFAYDGQKSAYTTRKLSDMKGKVVYQPDDGGRAKEYTVQVKEAAQLDLAVLKTYMNSKDASFAKPMSAIQCLDVVLRCAYENNPNFVRFKRCVYMVPSNSIDIGKGHELWYGLFQSAVLGSRPYINLDVSHKAFPCASPLLKVISDFNRGNLDQLNRWVVDELQTFLKGMDVVYKNPSGITKRMRCNGLRDPANQQMFKMDDGTRLSVADYFARHLNYRLRYPNLPVVHVGSTVRSVYVPAELCDIPGGQALTKNHPEECTRDIIRYAATNTQTRKQKIVGLASQIQYNSCPTLLDFGIGVGKDFEQVPARIIDAPPIEYARNEKIAPRSGVWRAEGKNFLQPSTELSRKSLRWRILNLDGYTNEATVKKFGEMLQQQAIRCNVQMEPFDMGSTYVLVRNPANALRDIGTLLEGIKQANPAITIVILPSRGDAYAKVKQKAELASERIGLLTQCVKGMTVAKKSTDMSTLNNIMLKINAKTNGANHCISQAAVPPLGRGNVMYIGADVTHPLSDDVPSVVGVTALYDTIGFRYNCSVRLQGARDEMIRDLENIVHRQLQLYEQYNKVLPERIMYYRDGVSDGQFSEILTIELQALHAAIARVKPGYKPAVTFIVVQKRHHTRFFPHGNCPSDGKNCNVPPGTVVDSEITLPNRYEFYLVSHAAVQGVAKPTKYVVLYDDSSCNPDHLQALTYNLCHLFARCNRSVSYPAPTYYAHLAAYRGRVYIKDRRINMNNLDAAYRDIQIISSVTDTNPMFFV
ncbi:protein argonaute-2 isoform X9 [Anopheles funestus]|uniref:protein argonaute-2 isoform X9 n=1 Tax=Anopheles funestus TaxID=62324 RepID=UPI0020C6609B|nr:protein argonaute-2 isoform X9 [Anopheles funestus]